MNTLRFWSAVGLHFFVLSNCGEKLQAQSLSDLRTEIAATPFVPVTEAELSKRRAEVELSFADLMARIPRGVGRPSAWENFIVTARLIPEFEQLSELQRVEQLLGTDVSGMEYAPLQRYRRRIQEYVRAQTAAKNPLLSEDFLKHQRVLLDSLAEFTANGSAAAHARIAGEAHWAYHHGQWSNPIVELRKLSHRNNLEVQVSRRFIAAYIQDSFVRPKEVKDCILGTAIRGHAIVSGCSDVELVPCDSQIKLNITVRAAVSSDTVGYKGPVRVYSNGATDILTRKPVVFDGRVLRGLPAYSHADTTSVTKGIETKFNGLLDRLVTKIAAGQLKKKRNAGNAEASLHAERDANISVDEEADRMLADSNATYFNEFTRPATIRGFLPERFDLSTQSHSVRFATLFAGSAHIGAFRSPTIDLSAGDVRAHIHQTMVNNLLDIYLANKSFTLDELKDYAESFDPGGTTSDGNDSASATKSTSQSQRTVLTLESRYPVELVFDNQQIFVKIRAKTVQIDRTTYSAMNIGLRFNLRKQDGQWLLEYDGQPEIVPPRVELDPQSRLSGPEVAARRILRNLIARELPKSTPIRSLPLTKDGKQFSVLKPSLMHSQLGWLSLCADM